jgi:SAM-dependent methyltransferase
MISRTFLWLTHGSGHRRRWLFRRFFEFIARRSQDRVHWTFMNYGFAGTDGAGHTFALDPCDEQERYCCQLYDRVDGDVAVEGRDVLEVSSGRGGGAAFIARCRQPRTLIGIDIAGPAVTFCRKVHRLRNLRFLQGDAEELPLFESSVDVVINVEASFCYGDFERFLNEVWRVLRPGGYFLHADLRLRSEIAEWQASIARSGLDLVECDDITANVVRALDLDSGRREQEVRQGAPWYLRTAMRTFGGTRGTHIPRMLASGEMCYRRFVLKKPDPGCSSTMTVSLAARPAAPVAGAQPEPAF